MPAPTPLPQILVGRSFALQEASSSLSRRRSQATDLFTPSRGIRVPWGVDQPLEDILRPVLLVTPGAVASHATAARLWHISLPAWQQGELRLHITRPGTTTAAVRFGVVGHRLRLTGDEVCLAEGLPCTTPARTWLDLASVLTLDDLVAAGDSIICAHQRSFEPERPPLALPTALARTVAAHRGARGVATAREALQLLRVGSDSPPETLLRLELVRARLPEPELNVVIRDSLGKDVAWPDLAYRKYRIAIQYDGAHHLSPDQQESDARRDRGTMLAGWISITVTSALLEDVGYSGVVSMIRGALLSRGWNPSD
ncbi:MAG: hypothetical protein JWO93_1002 [Micrococcaceae bacterium]|nr:hypothetical protein [Micrococcaceae bacterium]